MDGILNIKKEAGYTSHDVVAKLRGILHIRKIGHTGTLDPDATGVLPICIGKATKLCALLTDKDKTYRTVFRLGMTTDTQDISGNVIKTGSTDGIKKERILACIASFCGSYEQLPPMYSAVKVNGKRLYELAREGKEVERKKRKVTIYSMEDIRVDLEKSEVSMTVCCSRGTYIRTLCHDIGEKLGCGAVMLSLVRTRVSSFLLEDAITLAEVERLVKEDAIEERLIPIEDMFSELTGVTMQQQYTRLPANGNRFFPQHTMEPEHAFLAGEQVRVYGPEQGFMGIYRYTEAGEFVPVKMFL